MKEEQRVYIKGGVYVGGEPDRGKEVIEALESLGGINAYNLTGTNSRVIYYISHDHNYIDVQNIGCTEIYKIIIDCYKELKLPNDYILKIY